MKILGILGGLGTTEIILIALVILLLFGGKKIPELMKGIGKGVKNFKDGVKGIEDDLNADEKQEKEKVQEKDKSTPAGT
jgi:sec-independent protein translocase protein TatA